MQFKQIQIRNKSKKQLNILEVFIDIGLIKLKSPHILKITDKTD